ncbi:hypothetical protein BBAD15_g11931 [Beauveria bassiana D1-5]|uniref:Uncharacterized protein n=1 Tax=Beauveria bassiana D1-5 TaxID=1245745 RepID=A0A0A2V945_BEABA|nr:hypothetical protein BBAD15_g11931 [Beauveria bassiana D1-5]
MPILASRRRQGVKRRVGKVQAGRTVRVPCRIGTVGTALATIADEEGRVGDHAIERDNDPLATILSAARLCLQREVAHSHEVVGIDAVERQGRIEIAHNASLVLQAEIGTTGLRLLDVIVVGAEALPMKDYMLGRCRGGQSQWQR